MVKDKITTVLQTSKVQNHLRFVVVPRLVIIEINFWTDVVWILCTKEKDITNVLKANPQVRTILCVKPTQDL